MACKYIVCPEPSPIVRLILCYRFRWAACQLPTLEKCLDLPMLEKRLATFPSTLAETYSRILGNIPDDYRPNAIKILQFLTYSEYPISLEEAVDIIATDPTKDPPFEARNRMRKANETLLLCSSLVSPVTSMLIERYAQTGVRIEIHLAHFSVKEFLRSGTIKLEFCQQLSEAAARASIVQVCLAYLSSLKLGLQLQHIRLDYPLAQLSAKIWMSSAAAAESDIKAQNMLLKFFSYDRRAYANWCRLITLQDLADTTTATDPHFNRQVPLYHVALLGLDGTMAALLQSNDHGPIQAQDFMYALGAATRAGDCRMIELLLQHQQPFAKVSQGASFLSALDGALQEASSMGYKQIVKDLIHQGASVNARGGTYDTALQAAAAKGHASIVTLLLNTGADLDARGGRYGTALLAATLGDRQQVVQILLANGADTAFEHGRHGTALRAACVRNNARIVGMLLENDANNNEVGRCYAKELCTAASDGHESIVRLLLDAGANVNARAGQYDTALLAAILENRPQVVQTLLARGADTSFMYAGYGTALQVACVSNKAEIVGMLLENDVKDKELGRCYAEELSTAACNGHEGIVRLLLDRGAHLTFEVLLAIYAGRRVPGASSYDPFGIMGFRLQDRTRVDTFLSCITKDMISERDARDEKTLLHWAAEMGFRALVNRCLELGAKVDTTDVYGKTALHYAAQNGHVDIVHLLVQANADRTIIDFYGRIALDCAQGLGSESNSEIIAYLQQ
jgi:ankyrin repeat protein